MKQILASKCGVCSHEKDYHCSHPEFVNSQTTILSLHDIHKDCPLPDAPATVDIKRIIMKAFERIEPLEPHGMEGAQQIDGQWCMPLWGCDTMQHIIDEMGTATVDRPTMEEVILKTLPAICQLLPFMRDKNENGFLVHTAAECKIELERVLALVRQAMGGEKG